jgi:hypothetical protein
MTKTKDVVINMSKKELKTALEKLELGLSTGARFLHIDRRTLSRYLSRGSDDALPVPPLVAMLVRTMVALKLKPQQVLRYSGLSADTAEELTRDQRYSADD